MGRRTDPARVSLDVVSKADEHERLIVAGREVVGLESGQGSVCRGGRHEARSRALLPRRRRRRAARRRRTAERARALPERHRRRVLLPEARTSSRGRRGSRSCRSAFRPGRTAEEVVPRDAAALAWMANLACLELHPHPVRAEDLDHPDELRVDLDPVPGVTWDDMRRVARVVQATLADFGLVGWPKTSGSRGMHVYVRIEPKWTFGQVRRAALAFAREVERRAPGAGDEQVVEGRAPRRVPRLQPEREGPHDRRRLLGPADARRPRVGAARLGRDRRVRAGRLHARDDAGALRGARRSPCRHRRAARLARAPARALGAPRARGSGRCAVAAAIPEAAGRAAARAAVAAARVRPVRSSRSAAPQRKEDALAGLERWRARHPEAAAHLLPADVLVDAMRGRFRTWTRIRVNLQHVPVDLRPAQEALDPDAAPNEWEGVSPDGAPRRRPSRARKAP